MIVYIPAAGLGSRLRARAVSKPLMSVRGMPLIWRILDTYPNGTEFLIALGFQGELLRQVVDVYAEARQISVDFCWTESFKPGTKGLTQTLVDSKAKLQRPFIFHAVDSILEGRSWGRELLNVTKDTAVFAPTQGTGEYRLIRNSRWQKMKVDAGTEVYVGVAAIQNWKQFWKEFDQRLSSDASESGESLGLDPTTVLTKVASPGQWIDASLFEISTAGQNEEYVLPKNDEAIWKLDSKMIKLHTDEKFISNRVERAKRLVPYVPKTREFSKNILIYERAEGQVLARCSSSQCFREFLAWCRNFWRLNELGPEEGAFEQKYFEFYKSKTDVRLAQYLAIHDSHQDGFEINDIPVMPVRDQLRLIAWESICSPLISRAHGDLHKENVIHNHESRDFVFVDWRQDIAGEVSELGDVYYDLAKTLHGLIVDHKIVLNNNYTVDQNADRVRIRIEIEDLSIVNVKEFYKFCFDNNLDFKKVWLLTGLIYLNISPLHHQNYDSFLFWLGRLMLASIPSHLGEVEAFLSGISGGQAATEPTKLNK